VRPDEVLPAWTADSGLDAFRTGRTSCAADVFYDDADGGMYGR
jgi:hypothetical protein